MSENLKTDFDILCKETIIPFFKESGFKRKALHFSKQTNDLTQCFNVQKSQWNSYNDSIDFTFNFGFYNAEISSIVDDKVIQLEFPKTYDCFIYNRLGIFSHKRDHWYTLSKNIDTSKTAEQIKTDLEKYLKPIFENYDSLEKLQLFLDKDSKYISPTFSPYYLIAFYMTTGQIEKGNNIIKEHYKKALNPQQSTHTINFPDGRQQVKSETSINQHYIDNIKRFAKKYNVELEEIEDSGENIKFINIKESWLKKLFGI